MTHLGAAFASHLDRLQPQDDGAQTSSKIASISARINPLLGAEPEDARITGSTRSLFRRVMGLNVRANTPPHRPLSLATARKPQSVSVAGAQQAQVA